ncbi:MAG: 5-oxoprolinase subunit PxpB [Thermodesulfobacteriota bacterium]
MAHVPVPVLRPCGDSAVSVELGEGIDLAVNRRVHALGRALAARSHPGIVALSPAYRSLFVEYDPRRCSFEELALLVEEAAQLPDLAAARGAEVEIPVCYGGVLGPDLEEVAAFHGLDPARVAELHAAPVYHVYLVGFTPGFPYLGGLDPRLHTPRRATPRERVAAGSVGIADRQTGIYPIESPGGWQLIGRTPLRLFDLGREPPFLVPAGARLRFLPISREEYDRLAGA